jgi:hypothetical protein
MPRSTRPPSPDAQSLTDQIRRMHAARYPVREIARRTELSKSHVHNIIIGKRNLSPARANAAAEHLSREQSAFVFADGQLRAIDPLGRRERQKLGRYMRAVQDAKTEADFRDLRRRFRRMVIKTSEGEVHPETDPEILRELDDAGILDIDEVFRYEPTKRAA